MRWESKTLDKFSLTFFLPGLSALSLLRPPGNFQLLHEGCTTASRELTQASNLADDLILVQMGAVPEGLSAEKKDAFVVGLRQIIQEIRGRKVKDFRIVASEIAAYRARFLGDSSKILPL